MWVVGIGFWGHILYYVFIHRDDTDLYVYTKPGMERLQF